MDSNEPTHLHRGRRDGLWTGSESTPRNAVSSSVGGGDHQVSERSMVVHRTDGNHPPRTISAYDFDEPEVGLRLVSDAPLPDDLSSLVIDPSTPADIPSGLRTALDGQPLDIAHLAETVDSYALSRVSVTELHGNTERTVESSQ